MKPQPTSQRWSALAALVVVAAIGGAQLVTVGAGDGGARVANPRVNPAGHARDQQARETKARFEQAVTMLHAKQFEHAATALHRVLELAPRMPEAHVNMGFAMLGLKRHGVARDFFATAIELRPQQANAYYGLALAAEGAGDLESGLGAMRSFLHLSPANDPYRVRARAALWEWERALGRHDEPVASAKGTSNAPRGE